METTWRTSPMFCHHRAHDAVSLRFFFLFSSFFLQIMKILQIMKLVARLAQKGRGRLTVNYHFHSLGLKNFWKWRSKIQDGRQDGCRLNEKLWSDIRNRNCGFIFQNNYVKLYIFRISKVSWITLTYFEGQKMKIQDGRQDGCRLNEILRSGI